MSLYIFFQIHRRSTPGVNPNESYGLWVTMLHQCRFIGCSKYITLLVDGESRGGCECGQGVYGKSLYLPLNFTMNSELLENTKSFFKSSQISQCPSWEVRCHPCHSHPPSDLIDTQDL